MPTIALSRPTAANVTRSNGGERAWEWAGGKLVDPSRFNTWPMVRELAMALPRRLEVAPGLRPRLPLDGTYFIDVSRVALASLRSWGASAACGTLSALPCPDASFDLICALDILEHMADREQALHELSRVAAPDARLLLSVPVRAGSSTGLGESDGHDRRVEPGQITARLAAHGWVVEQSTVYDQPSVSRSLATLGRECLQHRGERALWWYNRVLTPWELRLQRPLRWRPGLVSAPRASALLLLCRRT
ncbi:class I SAM-dependent methyltransferase [Dyella solisilvae]|uniref:Class I SAM-dependent methyltransferase n=1 Tax=Dyella solisilvae TaxID=1920168 RepID=A0A370KCJ8_9GAMM|nr:methyltransferase domain-containing protein [Dyella solisilvae]RDJ00365.1 class I SAM-dependent methyltransferase [Dyella solisilvae]